MNNLPALGALHQRGARFIGERRVNRQLLPAIAAANDATGGVREDRGEALPGDARLLHPTWPSKLLHVLAEVTVAAVGPQTRVALFAARSPSPRGVIRRLGRRRWATIVSGIGWRCRRIWRCKLLLLMLIVLLLLMLMLLLMVRRLLMRLLVMVSTVVLVMSTRRGRRRRVVLRRSGRNTGR